MKYFYRFMALSGAVAAVGAAAYFIFPTSVRSFMARGSALIAQSWSDAAGGGASEEITMEIVPEGDASLVSDMPLARTTTIGTATAAITPTRRLPSVASAMGHIPALLPANPSSSVASFSIPNTSQPVVAGVAATSATLVAAPSVTVFLRGDGRGMVTSSPPGISCGLVCAWSFSPGVPVTLRATPDTTSVFRGWSGPCSGTERTCVVTVRGSLVVTALFRPMPAPLIPSPPVTPPIPPPPLSPAPPPASTGEIPSIHLLIAAVQIAGASTTNDFVKIFNPATTTADINGWRLRKKTNTGSDQSIRQFPSGSSVPPGGYFMWANAAGGFADAMHADASSTATLAAGNSVGLLDASGTVVDAVAWGGGAGQYVEGTPYLTDPGPDEVLVRKMADGEMTDTDNNADDFTI